MKIALNLETCTVVLGEPGAWDFTVEGGTAALRDQKAGEIGAILKDIPSPPDDYSWIWYAEGSPYQCLIWEIIKD